MKFQCPGCQLAFSVPDEKIPEGKGLRILCPKCRTPVERTDGPSPAGSFDEGPQVSKSLPPFTPPVPPPETPSPFVHEEEEEEASSIEVVEEGVKTLLLCCSDASRTEQLTTTLQQLDFYVSRASRMRHALLKLDQNHYDMVLLDESFAGSDASDNPLLHHIQLLPMHVRREFFMCLLSETLPSLDRMVAFRMGVDMILNVQDLDKTKIILLREMKDHGIFYKVFVEELMKKGKL